MFKVFDRIGPQTLERGCIWEEKGREGREGGEEERRKVGT